MSCDIENIAQIIKGEDKDLLLRIKDKDSGDPYPLTTPDTTEIVAKFLLEDQSISKCLEESLTGGGVVIVSQEGGKIKVSLSAADTALLKKGQRLSFEIEITKNSKISIAQFNNALDVLESVCA